MTSSEPGRVPPPPPPIRWGRDMVVVLGAVLPRPWLWSTALAALVRLARRGWWRRPPFLPLPGNDYWHFRLVTVFGGTGSEEQLTTENVVDYLEWCRRSRPSRG